MSRIRQFFKRYPYIYYRISYIHKVFLKYRRKKRFGKTGRELLQIVSNMMKESEFSLFSAFGTLLGVIRDNGLIEGDFDIDIGILDNNFSWDAFEKESRSYGLKKVKQFEYRSEITEQTYSYKGNTVDFFLFQPCGGVMEAYIYYREKETVYESEKAYSVLKCKCPICNKYLSKMTKEDLELTIPFNYKEILESMYGINWEQPDPNFSHAEHDEKLEGEYAYITYF